MEWIEQEQLFIQCVRKEIYNNHKKFVLCEDMTNYLIRNKIIKSKKELQLIFEDKTKLEQFLLILRFDFLCVIAQREQLCMYKSHINVKLKNSSLLKYLQVKKLKLSYSIKVPKKILSHESDTIHAMHSVGKIVTGFLIHLLARLKIIPSSAFYKPLQLDTHVIAQLCPKIVTRLKSTTMLDVMTHKSGLGDYIENYIKTLDSSLDKNLNPQEPEEFLCWGDTTLQSKGEEHYSNFGILLCGLSAKYHYNKNKPIEQHLTYNQILYKYIVKPFGLTTFMIKYKQIKNIKTNRDYKNNTRYLNGSPAGGYWISTHELMKLGCAICEAYMSDCKLMSILKKYGSEFYDKSTNVISHYGSLAYSTAYLEIDLSTRAVVAIQSNHYNDTDILTHALHLFN